MKSKSIIVVALLLGLLFVQGSVALATSVSKMSLTNLVGYPGKTVKTEITLEGTNLEERSGSWSTHYKNIEGDDNRMDITSWLTIKPENFTIQKGETKTFTVKVKVPRDAELGLWGATSKEAGKEGHSSERRTYIIFKDVAGGGNVYSGLLIPISIEVTESPNIWEPVINFVMQNIIIIVLSLIILVLVAKPLLKRKK